MENIKLSFIVPVYNVAAYLRKCMDSLLAQDYEDYEIILVDDGSTDNSGAICDEYASPSFANSLTRSVVIKVIHQANAGLSAARNTGIVAAKGEYICFVDSDDYWETNVLGGLMAQVERDNLDVLRFKYRHVNEQYEVFSPYKANPYRNDDYSEEITDGLSFLNSRFGTACYAVMFIIKKEILNLQSPISNVKFTEGIFFEDTDWTPRMLCKAKRVASTNTIVYNYLQREGSITNAVNRSNQKKVLDDKMRLIETMQCQAQELSKHGKDKRWFARMIADTVISIMGILSTQFYDERKAYLAKLKESDVYPIQSRIVKAKLINLSPRLAVALLHIKNG